jgi:serine/threonine protein kinase/Tol biopolymer transport system component
MPDEWKQISDLYHAALKLPENERAAFLQSCIASDGVRREVASLLANERTAEHLLDSPALEVAARMMSDNPAVLTIGQTLAHYQIKSRLGKGGMGEVYRAHDGKLGRDVAIKTLPPEFARDPERVARFNREAKLLASLNHPNIAAIYGLEESGGTNFLVLEMAEGETLADRIRAGPIPIEESLKLALQIAAALEAAHEKGVIHRDLKPANIKVTPEGKVKVLDFGLAKAFAGEQAEMNLSNSPTLSNMATQQGVILGTAAYMSPEQARGKPVDKRADIWAFGCVLFEMLTGRATFTGDDVSDILAAVIRSEPDWTGLPASLHWRLREILDRCLKKDARDRYHDISDVRIDIQKAIADPGGGMVQMVTAAEPRMKLRTILPWITSALVLGLIIAAVAVWKFKTSEPRQVMRFDCELPESLQLQGQYPIAVSPDGRKFVYSTSKGLYLRSLDELTAKPIAGTEKDAQQPFFSPDGKWIAYISPGDRKLKKIAINGGTSVPLCDYSTTPSASWGADDTIVYSEFLKGIMRVSANGGTPESVIRTPVGLPERPQILPDGRSVLYATSFGASSPERKIMIQSLKSGEPKELFPGISAQYLPTGHIVYQYADNSNLFAVPFDPEKQAVAGGHVAIVEGVGVRQYAISESGTLVYMPGTSLVDSGFRRTLMWVDREGKEEALPTPPDYYQTPRISPDGKQVALAIFSGGTPQIHILDLTTETMRRLTFDKSSSFMPIWTPDGKRIVFTSNRDGIYGIYWKAADGTGEVQKLGSAPDRYLKPYSCSRDGKNLAIEESNFSFTHYDIGTLSMEGDHARRLLLHEEYVEGQPNISPDGKYVAYVSMESGGMKIYVRPFPEVNNGKWQIPAGNGAFPVWSPDGRELFYVGNGAVMTVPVDTRSTFKAGKPRILFEKMFVYGDSAGSTWDISPDGKRFLMIKQPVPIDAAAAVTGPRRINIFLNWTEELKQRVPEK